METMHRRRQRVIIVPIKLLLIWILWLSRATEAAVAGLACQYTCGDVPMRFPFGIGEGCFMNKSFEVVCNYSFSPPKPYLTSINMELLALKGTQVQVNNPVISSNCKSTAHNTTGIFLSGSPFAFSSVDNMFTAMGCNNYAVLVRDSVDVVGGCMSICPSGAYNNASGCYGINCCQASIPSHIQAFQANITNLLAGTQDHSCKSAFMVEQDWFQTQLLSSRSLDDLKQKDHVPAVLDWATVQGSCDISRASNIECTRDRNYCWKQMNISQVCICSACQDFIRCTDPRQYYCSLYCMNEPGGFNCSCPSGHHQSSYSYYCFPDFVSLEKSKTRSIIIGCGSGIGFLLLLIGMWSLYKLIKRRRALKLKQKFFKRNGGLLLQQQLSSTENHVEQTKVFTSKELEIATDHYNVNRILGQGGQGTVYKGMLTDGRVVAIKKSKVVDEDKLDQFINEVVILSQINHRNVVKLFGCCLETEVPLLVYEFIPNGTLFQYIHNQNGDLPLTWKMRLQIAAEVAGALSYLHSAAYMPIYHRDIKTSNILLDEKYRAKVADFGTSKSISIDQTHVTTRVQGTFGYLDPEYFQSSQFTEKSDVYSFGVVLVELLTGQKPICSLRSVEQRSLATYFLLSMEEDSLFEIVDSQVLEEGRKEEIIGVAMLAKRCLSLNGKKRPTMKTVAMELERIRESQADCSTTEQQYEEVDYKVGDYTGPWEVASSSTRSLNSSLPSRLDGQPLLSNITS